MVTLRVNASKHPTETPLGRDASNNAAPHNIPQKHTTKYTNLTYVWGPYISTGSATRLEINCECEVIKFYHDTGNLYKDKPVLATRAQLHLDEYSEAYKCPDQHK